MGSYCRSGKKKVSSSLPRMPIKKDAIIEVGKLINFREK